MSDAAWPAGTVVIAIQRGEERIFPELDTTLVAGDHVSVLAPAGKEDQIHRLVAGAETEPDESAEDETLI